MAIIDNLECKGESFDPIVVSRSVFHNRKRLDKILGDTDISSINDGTITGGISKNKTDKDDIIDKFNKISDLADVITDKGVPTDPTDSPDDIATNISNIVSGGTTKTTVDGTDNPSGLTLANPDTLNKTETYKYKLVDVESTNYSLPKEIICNGLINCTFHTIVYNNLIYLFYNNCYRTSSDGVNWSEAATHAYGNLQYRNCMVVYNNMIHIINANLHICFDGTKWTSLSTPSSLTTNPTSIFVIGDYMYIVRSNYVYRYKNSWVMITGYAYNATDVLPVLHNGYMWEFDKDRTKTINVYRSSDGELWTGHSYSEDDDDNDTGIDISGSCIVSFNNQIHLFGSGSINDMKDPSAHSNHYVWDETNEVFTFVDKLKMPIYNSSAVVYNGVVHIFGGTMESSQHLTYSSNGTQTLYTTSTLPYDISNCMSVVYNGEMYVLGGYGMMDKMIKWNGSTWVEVCTLPYPFIDGAATVYKGCIYIVGTAMTSTDDPYGTYTYRWDGSTWTELDIFDHNVSNVQITGADNRIYILFKSTDDGAMHFHYYNIDTAMWVIVTTNIPTNTYRSIFSYNDNMYVIGYNSNTGYTYVYKYDDSLVLFSTTDKIKIDVGNCIVNDNTFRAMDNNGVTTFIIGNHILTFDGSAITSDIEFDTCGYSHLTRTTVVLNGKFYMMGGPTNSRSRFCVEKTERTNKREQLAALLGVSIPDDAKIYVEV